MELQSSFSEGRESRGKSEDLKSQLWAEGLTVGKRHQGRQMEELIKTSPWVRGVAGAWSEEDLSHRCWFRGRDAGI